MCVSGNCSSAFAAESAVLNGLTIFTTSPRLTDFAFILELIAYQLISVNVMPPSFTAIQVPPPGSDGARTRRPAIIVSDGGKPMARDNLFVAIHRQRVAAFAWRKSNGAHGSISDGIGRRECGIVTPRAPACGNGHRHAAAPAVFCADGKDQIPLPKQRAIRGPQ